MVIKLFRCAILLALLPGGAVAFAPLPDTTLGLAVDFARFRINDEASQVEIYVSVPRAQLKFEREGEEWVASFESRVTIARGDSEVINHAWMSYSVAQDTAEVTTSQMLYTQAAFQLPAADYRALVRIRDTRSGHMGLQSLQIPVERYDSATLTLSDLEISARMSRDSTWSPFYKNRYTVIPNPGATFGLGLPMLYCYAEIYNLSHPSDSSYSVTYRVFDGQGNPIKTLPGKRRPIAGRQLVEVGAFNVVALPSGSYHLEVRVIDHTNQQESVRRRKFFIYRENEPVAAGGPPAAELAYEYLMSVYRNRPAADLDNEFRAARYIATREEQKVFSSLDLNGKRDFVVKFWQARDVSPETARNEFREDYLARAKYANDNFSGIREGVLTDMGRILLTYGRPDEIERFPSSSENRPYQMWKYFEIQGGVDFVFVDVNNWGEYKLVHSTARGELSDIDWQRWINPAR